MSINKKAKTLIVFLILVITMLVIGNLSIAVEVVDANGNKVNLDTTTRINFNIKVLRNNNNIYCVEQGKPFDLYTMEYNRSEKHIVQDPTLNYILGKFEDEPKLGVNGDQDYKSYCLKQNLIWWYMTQTGTNADLQFIRGRGTDHTCIWPTDRTMNPETPQLKAAMAEATNYANNIRNYGISITNMHLDEKGENVLVTVSGVFDSYKVYTNGNEYRTFSGAEKNISIPISAFGGDSSATVRVVAQQARYQASIYVLYRTTNTSQKFICIDSKSTTLEASKSTEVTIQLNTNVSLQKYISEVNGKSLVDLYNGGDKNIVSQKGYSTENVTLANDQNAQSMLLQRWSKKASLDSRKDICAANGGSRPIGYVNDTYMSRDYYKINRPVNIEKGDIVTYNIYIYNNDNSRVAKNITVSDQLLYLDANKKDSAQINFNSTRATIVGFAFGVQGKNSSTYNPLNVGYRVTNGKIATNSFNLGAGETARIILKVKFNQQEKSEIKNYAKITSTNNKTDIYRTDDADYIAMKKYEVSLEKYISNVTHKTVDTIDLRGYENILAYLRSHSTETLDSLISKNKDISLDYKKYDLNGDNKVDSQDINIYKNANKSGMLDDIEKYIRCDLNADGIVNELDLNIYKIIKANLNEDTGLNQYDRYIYILKLLYDDGLLEKEQKDNLLKYLNIQKALIKINKNLSGMQEEIENYIKSDINEDGYVTSDDLYNLSNYNIRENVANALRSYTLENIKEISGAIKEYDINEDGVLDNKDIELIQAYYDRRNKGTRYYMIANQLKQNLRDFTDSFKNRYTAKVNAKNYDLDVNIDGILDFEDYILAVGDEQTQDRLKTELRLGSYSSAYDLNGDKQVDATDYLILKEYNRLIEKNINVEINQINEIVLKHNIFDIDENNPSLSQDDLNVLKIYLGLKEYNPIYNELYSVYDLNEDAIVNQNDIEYLIQYGTNGNTASIYEIVKSILNANDIDEFIVYLNANSTSEQLGKINIDFREIDNQKTNFDILNEILTDEKILSQAEGVLSNFNGYKAKIADVNYTDMLSSSQENKDNLDINGDGIINELDKEALGIKVPNIDDIRDIEDICKANDLDEDGDWDEDDIKLSTQIKLVQNNEQIKNEIINRFSEEAINEALKDRPGKAEHKYDNNINTNDNWKYNHIVDDIVKGEIITYTIKVTNDSQDTSVYITEITDYLPDGVKYGQVEYNGGQYNQTTDNAVVYNELKDKLLAPGESASFTVDVEVIEPNISTEIMKNTATITTMQNKNRLPVEDETPNNNTDSDYFQMKDITISGTVWNDIAWNKKQNNYNGIYENEEGKDKPLPGVKVYLYRRENAYRYDLNGDGNVDDNDVTTLRDYILGIHNLVSGANADIDGNGRVTASDLLTLKNIIMNNTATKYTRETGNTLVSMTTTDEYGKYTFALDYIKGPKITNTNRWAGTYYSYYVVFEYDGVTYTASLWKDVTSNDPYDSNAREDIGRVNKTRQAFNNQFTTINNNSGIQYNTTNGAGYIPQSNHIAKDTNGNLLDKYKMQSSTALISLSKSATLEQQLQHVNLGLRGRDVFDLELETDIYSTRVDVNGKQGVYQYNNNKVTLRRTDISNEYSYSEDMEHVYSQRSSYEGDIYNQGIRKTDIDVKKTGANVTPYTQTNLEIEVTYKVTVTNTSATDGTATKITDYYDSRYNFVRAYSSDGKTLTTSTGTSGTGYKSVRIITPGTNLSRNETMDVYLVFTLNNPTQTLKALADGTLTRIPTYNIAEIEEYRTRCAKNQTEYIRGLLDKNSAPGSANKEQVRLTSTEGQNTATINGNPTTIGYYFGGTAEERKALKYENDTYEAPVLYFTAATGLPKPDPEKPADPVDPTDPDDPDNPSHPDIPGDNGYAREITGIVFRDTTTTNQTTKIKTGNGKLDRGEVGVYGATVSLIEVKKNLIGGVGEEIAVRYRVTTNKNGRFTISGFLPGDYILRYEYGDTTNTVLLNQAAQDINKYSFNGEDYQSTNNTGNYGAAKLNATSGFWYVYNEKDGISTATDNKRRRSTVSTNVTNFTDEQMTVLNNMRDGKDAEQSKVSYQKDGKTETVTVNNIIDQTKMNAGTELMEFLVEKTENLGDRLVQRSVFGKYTIRNMNFGIAEVPVTTIDLQKHVQAFKITDSTGKNVLASMAKDENGKWQTKGNVLAETFDISIEDEQLQGARLEITYDITSKMTTEKNFDNRDVTVPTIKGIVDYIDNNLSYNPALGNNAKYWELTNYDDTVKEYAKSTYRKGTQPKGTVDPEGTIYTTIVKAKADNPILLTTAGQGTATITLEKVLSATDATIDQIVTSTIETFAYSNTVEITGLDHKNVTPEGGIPQRDRIRTPDRYIIIPGVQHDSATSETVVIHPPTGDNSISITYYVLAAVSLIILGAGTFSIKKFVLRTKK